MRLVKKLSPLTYQDHKNKKREIIYVIGSYGMG